MHVHGIANKINGWTVLMYAAESGSLECIDMLISAGSKASYVQKNGWTAAKVADAYGHFECAKQLKSDNPVNLL